MYTSRSFRRTAGALAGLCVAVVGCGGSESAGGGDTVDGGTLVIAAPAPVQGLLPVAIVSTTEKQVVDLLFDHLADIGPELNSIGDRGFTPNLARSWTWSADSLAVAFSLNPAARWHDGKPVRGHDVAFSYGLMSDPIVGSIVRTNLPRVDSVQVNDSLTVTFHFGERRADNFYALVYNLWIVPAHLLEQADRTKLAALEFAQRPVGSGPYMFARWERNSVLELTVNPAWHKPRAHLDRVVWTFPGDLGNAQTKVAAGEADLVELVRPEAISNLLASGDNHLVPYDGFDYTFLLFNLRAPGNPDGSAPHPIFGEPATRRALAMAVDRVAATRNAYDSLAAPGAGPFVRAMWSADTTLRHPTFDSAASTRLLDSLGWRDANGDGIRERNGRQLAFNLVVPVTSVARRRLAVVIQEQFRRVGADVAVKELDPGALFPDLGRGNFDAYIHTWRVEPNPIAVAQSWGGANMNASSNFARYRNATVDSLLDRARVEADPTAARALYRNAYQRIIDDVPAVFLAESKNYAAIHKRIETGPLRGDAWWAGIPQWHIPPAARIARDNVAPPEP